MIELIHSLITKRPKEDKVYCFFKHYHATSQQGECFFAVPLQHEVFSNIPAQITVVFHF